MTQKFSQFDNLSIVKNTIVPKSFSETIEKIKAEFREKVGNRKQNYTIKVQWPGQWAIDFTFYKNTDHVFLYRAMLREIWNQCKMSFRYNWNVHRETNLTYADRVDWEFSHVSGFDWDGQTLKLAIDKFDTTEYENVMHQFDDYIMDGILTNQHISEIKAEDTGYPFKPSVYDEEYLIDYLQKITDNAEILQIKKYKTIILELGEGMTYYQLANGFDVRKIFNWMNQWISREHDAIKIIPNLEGWTPETFLQTNVLKFKVIFNDDWYKTKKFLKQIESDQISAYYASRTSGGYCGD